MIWCTLHTPKPVSIVCYLVFFVCISLSHSFYSICYFTLLMRYCGFNRCLLMFYYHYCCYCVATLLLSFVFKFVLKCIYSSFTKNAVAVAAALLVASFLSESTKLKTIQNHIENFANKSNKYVSFNEIKMLLKSDSWWCHRHIYCLTIQVVNIELFIQVMFCFCFALSFLCVPFLSLRDF